MQTAFGKTMSPRATRIYEFINKNGVSLHTFSTDDNVSYCFPKLEKIAALLREMLVNEKARGEYTVRQIGEMQRDLAAIMSRRPETRIGNLNKVSAPTSNIPSPPSSKESYEEVDMGVDEKEIQRKPFDGLEID